MSDIACVILARRLLRPKVCAKERRAELGGDFFAGIAGVGEALVAEACSA